MASEKEKELEKRIIALEIIVDLLLADCPRASSEIPIGLSLPFHGNHYEAFGLVEEQKD